jgi:hypothetical protein
MFLHKIRILVLYSFFSCEQDPDTLDGISTVISQWKYTLPFAKHSDKFFFTFIRSTFYLK